MPTFALDDRGFVEEFLKAHGVTKANAVRELARYGHSDGEAVPSPLDGLGFTDGGRWTSGGICGPGDGRVLAGARRLG